MLIKPATSEWNSPVVQVRKRMVSGISDYRQLIVVTNRDAYALSRIDNSIDALARSQYFGALDSVSGYKQVL